ncbi:hypothetical protein ACKI1S_47015, partial [Streptomyces galilaeus]
PAGRQPLSRSGRLVAHPPTKGGRTTTAHPHEREVGQMYRIWLLLSAALLAAVLHLADLGDPAAAAEPPPGPGPTTSAVAWPK